MARTKNPKAEVEPALEATAAWNGAPTDVLTLAEAASYLRLSEADILRLVEEQGLPARQIGQERRFLRSAIQQWLSSPGPAKPSKAAQLAVAGSWKDDPLVEEELKETLLRRGRTKHRTDHEGP